MGEPVFYKRELPDNEPPLRKHWSGLVVESRPALVDEDTTDYEGLEVADTFMGFSTGFQSLLNAPEFPVRWLMPHSIKTKHHLTLKAPWVYTTLTGAFNVVPVLIEEGAVALWIAGTTEVTQEPDPAIFRHAELAWHLGNRLPVRTPTGLVLACLDYTETWEWLDNATEQHKFGKVWDAIWQLDVVEPYHHTLLVTVADRSATSQRGEQEKTDPNG